MPPESTVVTRDLERSRSQSTDRQTQTRYSHMDLKSFDYHLARHKIPAPETFSEAMVISLPQEMF